MNVTSWEGTCVRVVSDLGHVMRTVPGQCRHDATSVKGRPIKKPTGFMTHSACLAEGLEKTCVGKNGMPSRGLEHQLCPGEHAKLAAIYLDELCKATSRGSIEQLKRDRMLVSNGFALVIYDKRFEGVHVAIDLPKQLASGKRKDDLSGQVLADSLVEAARRVEPKYPEDRRVWVPSCKVECSRGGGKPFVTERWVDASKGDDVNINYRGRLVARQMEKKGTDSVFALIPPLEVARGALSLASAGVEGQWKVNWRKESPKRTDPDDRHLYGVF